MIYLSQVRSHHFAYVVYVHTLMSARAHERALMTRKLCTVGMYNAILRNHLKLVYSVSWCMWTGHRKECVDPENIHTPPPMEGFSSMTPHP